MEKLVNPQKILLTGIDGYIGVQLAQVLVKNGFKVTGLDTGYYRNAWLYNGVTEIFPSVVTKDIREVTVEDLKEFDAVVHLAELSNDPLGQNDPELTFDINHRGTMNLANCAKEAGVKKFVYFSSCSVYGASDNIANENSPVNPLTAYAQSKIMNEEALMKLADDNFSPTIMRNATAYGASPRMRFDLVVNNLAGLAWTTGEIKMDSDGTPWRPLVHILDISKAVVCILNAKKSVVHNEIFNIGDTKANYQIKQIAEIIGKTFTDCKISFNSNSSDKRNYRVNFDKINSTLPGFVCDWTVEMAVKELEDIFKNINMTEETFKSKNFTRLKQVDWLKETGQIDGKLFWRNK